jgi:hypothetical protein
MGAGGRGGGGGGVSLLGVYKAGACEDRPLLSGARWPAPSPPLTTDRGMAVKTHQT